MSTSKLKTIVIVILLLVNIAFLSLITAQKIDSGKRERREYENLAAVMDKNGISLEKEIIPKNISLTEYCVGRDTDSEKTAAQAILGECEYEDQGGNIFSYTSGKGTARFRGNGEFEITLLPGAGAEFSPNDAEKLVKSMGIGASLKEKNAEKAVFLCKIDGHPVFGCEVVFTYENGALVSVSGKRPTGEPEYRTDREFITAPTALMNFLKELSAGGYVCSSIEHIECGYMFFSYVAGDRTLTPVWYLETDTGGYYIDGISGIMVTS